MELSGVVDYRYLTISTAQHQLVPITYTIKMNSFKESIHKHQIMFEDKIPNPFQVILDQCTVHRHCDR